MKVTLYSLLFLIFPKAVISQTYNPVKLFDLATGADIIASGTISKLDDNYYYLDCILSKKIISTLKIQRYKAFPASYRFAKYMVGQQLFVFLKRAKNEYKLYDTGVESEIPITHDSLVVDMNCFLPETIESIAPKGLTPEYKKMQTFDVGLKKVFGLRFTPHYLYESIMAFRNCYQMILKKPNTYPSYTCFNFFDRCTVDKQNMEKRKSKLMLLMFQDMKRAQMKNCK